MRHFTVLKFKIGGVGGALELDLLGLWRELEVDLELVAILGGALLGHVVHGVDGLTISKCHPHVVWLIQLSELTFCILETIHRLLNLQNVVVLLLLELFSTTFEFI